jgi:hypothetical protein
LKKIYNFLILVISLFFAVGNTFAEPNKDKQPNKVLIGFYINGIHSLDLKTGTVGFDVYLWLKTKEKRDILDSVEIMNGSGIEKSSIIKEVINGEHYYSARLQLNSFQNFNFSKFPLDSQQIKLVVEDTVEDINSLVFEVDDKNSNISDSISLAGWKLGKPKIFVGNHVYKTNYGDSRMGSNSSSYSSTELVIPIERDGLGYFFKLLGTVFLSAAVAFLCLFIKPNNLDPRFGLAVGGIFAVVASNFVLSSMLPETSQVTMGETLLIMTMGFILIVILESVVSLRYFEGGRKKLSEKIDARSGVFLPLLYLMSVFFVIFYFLSL